METKARPLADSAIATRLAPRLAQLSRESLLELAITQACTSPDAAREADQILAVHAPLPEWTRSHVLLDKDLMTLILGMLPTDQHRCKEACSIWRQAWSHTLNTRPGELRDSRVMPLNSRRLCPHAYISDICALDNERLIVKLEHNNNVHLVDRLLNPISSSPLTSPPFDERIDMRFAVGNGSVYISHHSGVERLMLEGFPDIQTQLSSYRCSSPAVGEVRHMVLSHDHSLLFTSGFDTTEDDLLSAVLVALNANTLEVIFSFGLGDFPDPNYAEEEDMEDIDVEPSGLAILGSELFASHREMNRIHVYSMAGELIRTLYPDGEWESPNRLCVINERLYVVVNHDGQIHHHIGQIFEIDPADGKVLQQFNPHRRESLHDTSREVAALVEFNGLLAVARNCDNGRACHVLALEGV